MAQEVQISPDSIERTAKIRDPVAVPVLTVITLGIYGVYWWYQINREMVDLGRARNADGLGENATTSLLAVFPGFLIIVPPYVSLYNGLKRMQRAQEVTIGESTLNGWIVLALILGSFVIGIAGLIVPGYIQSEMNKAWKSVGSGQGDLMSETPPTAVAPAQTPETAPTIVTPAEAQPPTEPPAQA